MKAFQIKPGQKVSLKDFDPGDTSEFEGGKKEGRVATQELLQELNQLQEVLYAEHKHKVLIVLQAMDTGGKDGTIGKVFEGLNPEGVRVASFKVPTSTEAEHDYLWRIHQQTPGNGEIVIFNRSHYEDVLIVRVHGLVPPDIWKARYDQINDFEKMLWQEGTLVMKFFLHISPEAQKQRLHDRLTDETKRWKYNPGDLKERELWSKYAEAYEDVLSKTSTSYAPWTLVPADHKWYRDWVVASTLVRNLKDLKMEYRKPDFDVEAELRAVEQLR
jgi:PPK2 family polyphosphate:nucleotide phosphotransferase